MPKVENLQADILITIQLKKKKKSQPNKMITPLKHMENQKILFPYRVYKTNITYLKAQQS